jgi:transcriptional regulator with XRE-family HTH domain
MTKPSVTAQQPKTVQEWLDAELSGDAEFRRQVEETLNHMRIEQDLARLRERRNVSQRQLAKILGVSQPAIAKIESGKAKNLELKTLVRYAVALGGRVRIAIDEDERMRPKPAARRAGNRALTAVRGTTRKVAKAS